MFILFLLNSLKLLVNVLDLERDLEGYLVLSVKYRNVPDMNVVLYKAADVLLSIGDIIFSVLLNFRLTWLPIYLC
jgi:hypothetical protein